MAAMKKLVHQSVKELIKPSMMSRRVVSTSPRNDQGVTSLNLDATMGQCPFRKSMDSFTDVITPEQKPEVSEIQPFENIPGPKGLPIIGTLLDYFKKDGPKFSKMFEVYRQRALKYGNIYYEKVAAFDFVVVSSPHEYNRLVHAEGKYPHRREMMPVAHYRQSKGFDLGLVNSQGEEWYKKRTVVSKKMLKLSEVSNFSNDMGEVADDFVSQLTAVRDANGEVPALERELFKWAMESVGTFIFEERIGCLGKNPTPMAQSFIENLEGFFRTLQPLMYNVPIYKLFPTKLWREFEKYSDVVVETGRSLVEKKMSSMKTSDSKSAFLSYLFNEGKMTSKEVTGLVAELLSAAVETTSTATTWCLYNLAKNPETQQKLYEDINEMKAQNNGTITADELSKLPLVKAIVKETLRLYPITYATSRNLTEDLELGGYNLPAGTHVQANLYGMYHDPELFHQPEEFLPERWLRENSSKMDSTVKSMSQLIWGHGARMCIGRRIAEQEMHITLAKIVENFELSYNHEDVEPVLNTMMTPDRPVRIQFTPRQHD